MDGFGGGWVVVVHVAAVVHLTHVGCVTCLHACLCRPSSHALPPIPAANPPARRRCRGADEDERCLSEYAFRALITYSPNTYYWFAVSKSTYIDDPPAFQLSLR